MKVVNKKKGGKGQYIGRPSVYGNPFEIGRHGTRDEVIEKYSDYFHYRLATDDDFGEAVLELLYADEDLVCYCAPTEAGLTTDDGYRCHGQVILEHLERIQRARRGKR